MLRALRDIVTSVKESLGIAFPDVGAVNDISDATAGAVSGAGEAVTGAGGQITSKVTDLLGRFGG